MTKGNGKVREVARGFSKKRQAVDHAFSASFLAVIQLAMNFEMPVIILNAIVILAMTLREVGLLVMFELRDGEDEKMSLDELKAQMRAEIIREFGLVDHLVHPDQNDPELVKAPVSG